MGGFFFLILFVTYVVAIAKWFKTDHYAFWYGFKELIWALAPVINITYVWREWVEFILKFLVIVWTVVKLIFLAVSSWIS